MALKVEGAIRSRQTSRPQPVVAIVGAGFSGTMTAVQLARQAGQRELRIVLIDPSGRFGSGVAYGTRCTKHVLNVPAGNMSAFPDQPQHFVEWSRQQGTDVAPDKFMPRFWYGMYLQHLLDEARSHSPAVEIQRLATRVTDVIVKEDRIRLILEDGQVLHVDRVVLAGGNFPPSESEFVHTGLTRSPRYLPDAWRITALGRVDPDEPVLLIGTGLTMVDVAIELEAKGHRAAIHTVSRRGLLPHVHKPAAKLPPLSTPPEVLAAPRTTHGLLHAVRKTIRRLEQEGYDWRDVIGSLRGCTAELWGSLSRRERGRFLHHVRPYWDTHRHRLAPEVANQIDRLIAEKRLIIHRGRIKGEITRGNTVRVQLVARGSDRYTEVELGWMAPVYEDIDVAWVINCTGPDSDIRRVTDQLWPNLVRRGILQADDLGQGVLTGPAGGVIDASGAVSDRIFLIGPLRKAQLWESTAVPELRGQAAAIAKQVVASLATSDAHAPPLVLQEMWPENAAEDDAELGAVFLGEFI